MESTQNKYMACIDVSNDWHIITYLSSVSVVGIGRLSRNISIGKFVLRKQYTLSTDCVENIDVDFAIITWSFTIRYPVSLIYLRTCIFTADNFSAAEWLFTRTSSSLTSWRESHGFPTLFSWLLMAKPCSEIR